jgi:hypothetical protein
MVKTSEQCPVTKYRVESDSLQPGKEFEVDAWVFEDT